MQRGLEILAAAFEGLDPRLYRLKKLAAKHRLLLGGTAAIAALLTASTIFAAWLAWRATRAEGAAEDSEQRAQALERAARQATGAAPGDGSGFQNVDPENGRGARGAQPKRKSDSSDQARKR